MGKTGEASKTPLKQWAHKGSNLGPLSCGVEINTREHNPYFEHVTKAFAVESEWFAGKAGIRTFVVDEILSTKLRALLQRDKGRDVFDIGRALGEFDEIDPEAVVRGLSHYLDMSGGVIHRAAAEERLFAKIKSMTMVDDMHALAPASEPHLITEDAGRAAVCSVLNSLVIHMPGNSWVKSPEKIEELGLEAFMRQHPHPNAWQPK